MGFTWIHLNQVNVGTDAGIGCAPYQCWCISIRVGTCAVYKTGLNKYQTFCSQFKQSAVPTTEDTLVLLITHLAKQQLSPTQPYRCTCQLSVTLMLLIRNTKPSLAKITP